MPGDFQFTPPSNGAIWAGRIIAGLVVMFLAFDGTAKVFKVAPVLEASQQLGLPSNTIVGTGILLLACTVFYAVPQTALLGAILLTGYLGGATAIQLRVQTDLFSIIFPSIVGILTWAGVLLREPRIWSLLFRQ